MRICVIITTRPGGAKTRLADVLSPAARTELSYTMLNRMLRSLRVAKGIERILVVTPRAERAYPGVEIVHDPGTGQTDAALTGLAHIAGTADAAIVLAADTPRVTPAEIEALIESLSGHDVVVVPDRRGVGTNALGLRLPSMLRLQFGGASLQAHLRSAREAGARTGILALPGLGHDVDLPEDLDGEPLPGELALRLAEDFDPTALSRRAAALALQGFGRRISYSRKVFIPLTQLCRDVCHYCTFAQPPRKGSRAFLTPAEVVALARAGAQAGCNEALFTLGDKPELRYASAREELDALGFPTTLAYLGHCAQLVFEETGLLPHLNAGVMEPADLSALRRVSVSMGLMLETGAARLSTPGGPHHRSPDKDPAARLAMLRSAGEAMVPVTTGILVGIGETRKERIESLLAIRDLQDEFGHIQEVIIQNFRAKPGTRMARHPEPSLEDFLWTIAAARLIFGPEMSIQAPPNLSPGHVAALVGAGINDLGGISPVTPDFVNPEAPWPEIEVLEREVANTGRMLVERLAIVPSYAIEPQRWLDESLRKAVIRRSDSGGYLRGSEWTAGAGSPPVPRYLNLIGSSRSPHDASAPVQSVLDRAIEGCSLDEQQIEQLFDADGPDFAAVVRAADTLRARVVGDRVSYVVNRNINYTNVCSYSCGFCAFAKGRGAKTLRGPAYDFSLDEIRTRVAEAAARGATEVCLQGGIHPRYTGRTYLDILHATTQAAPGIHVHAFSPLEITHGAATLGLSIGEYLLRLRDAGLRTLPGTAAEILCDDVRAVICPDKLSTAEWLDVMRIAHGLGIRSTATIMFGHVERARHWAKHLLAIRNLQAETGGFTEFVPLPFVHMEAPIWRAGRARSGPSFREAILMHAVARLTLHPLIPNIQTSWVKMGIDGALCALTAGANDLGGTLMNESITRAAGGVNGQVLEERTMCSAIRAIGRRPRQRNTLYGDVPGTADTDTQPLRPVERIAATCG